MTKPRIQAYKHNWKMHQTKVYGLIFMVAQIKGLQFYQAQSNVIICCNSVLGMHREGGGRKSGKELHNKNFQCPFAPQGIVLKPNLNYDRQHTTRSDARTSFDHSDKHGGTYTEPCRGEIDFRIQGLLRTAVQEHDHIRKQAVQNHLNKEALQADVKQNRAFNLCSASS